MAKTKRKVTDARIKKLNKELKGNGAAIGRRVGITTQAANYRLRKLGL
jgi:hypothetical protein